MRGGNQIAARMEMLGHLLAGAGLGAALATALLTTDVGLAAMLADHGASNSLCEVCRIE